MVVTAAAVILVLIFIFSSGFLGITPASATLSDQPVMEQRLFTKTMNLHNNQVSNLCWLTWVWVRDSVQKTVHFLVSLGNFSPRHMCVVSCSSKSIQRTSDLLFPRFPSFRLALQSPHLGPQSQAGLRVFPICCPQCWLLLLTTLLGMGFQLCSTSSQLPLAAESQHFTVSLTLMKGPKWHTQLWSWGTGAAPSWKALNCHCSHQKFYFSPLNGSQLYGFD